MDTNNDPSLLAQRPNVERATRADRSDDMANWQPPEHDRNDTIKIIRDALKRRSGKSWSVIGGRGTAWGWIRVEAPPARRTWKCREKVNANEFEKWSDKFEEFDCGESNHAMSNAEVHELAKLFNIEPGQANGGVSIPASSDYRREYIDRALGKTPSKIAQPYWD